MHEVQVLHAFGEDECTDITGEARAVVEAQFLHAFGEDECTDITGEASAVAEVQAQHSIGDVKCTDRSGGTCSRAWTMTVLDFWGNGLSEIPSVPRVGAELTCRR